MNSLAASVSIQTQKLLMLLSRDFLCFVEEINQAVDLVAVFFDESEVTGHFQIVLFFELS